MLNGKQHPGMVARSLQSSIRRSLLSWYDRNRRDLPWRHRESDPYAQWVAEIMLQQTRVETVADYYERFLNRFPTLAALARADHDVVLKYWEGLGYYRRVLNLHKAARLLVEADSTIPQSAEALRRLPGIGTYTAAAISSIAHREPAAAVDGNVARVIARLFAIEADVLSSGGRNQVQLIADQLLSRRRPGDFNQAWMDFASLVCTPRNPNCPQCPLANRCLALTRNMVDRLPVRGNGLVKAIPELNLLVGLFWHDGHVLIRKRPPSGLWSGLWEWPNAEVNGRPTIVHFRRLARSLGFQLAAKPQRVKPVEHRLTHRKVVFHSFVCQMTAAPDLSPSETVRWVTIGQLNRLSMATAHRKVLSAIRPLLPQEQKAV
jgi:A/G-specific adenine glycosylase